jgi:hypothetical protein
LVYHWVHISLGFCQLCWPEIPLDPPSLCAKPPPGASFSCLGATYPPLGQWPWHPCMPDLGTSLGRCSSRAFPTLLPRNPPGSPIVLCQRFPVGEFCIFGGNMSSSLSMAIPPMHASSWYIIGYISPLDSVNSVDHKSP